MCVQAPNERASVSLRLPSVMREQRRPAWTPQKSGPRLHVTPSVKPLSPAIPCFRRERLVRNLRKRIDSSRVAAKSYKTRSPKKSAAKSPTSRVKVMPMRPGSRCAVRALNAT